MSKFPLKNPSPDFEEFKKVLKGEKESERVHFVEWMVDPEVMGFIMEKMMGEKQISLNSVLTKETINSKGEMIFLTNEEQKLYTKQYINFYYRLGYDCFTDLIPLIYLVGVVLNPKLPKLRMADDTAALSRGKRVFAEEGKGIITSWEDFEKFPWEKIKLNLDSYYEFLNKNLPEGMKVMVGGSVFEQVLERILGYEGLFYLLYDQPDLVEAVFGKWGEIIHNMYKSVISFDCVGGIFHADDLGYKTATMIKPDVLRKFVFPWFKKYASLAHQHNKMYWYHCCGNVSEVIEDLIEDVGIDGFHSFQDVIIPVTEFKKRYGDRIAILGGVDMDKLSRLDEQSLRKYIRGILDECMPEGRFALGSGNSIANFVPVENYLIMLEEGLKWG